MVIRPFSDPLEVRGGAPVAGANLSYHAGDALFCSIKAPPSQEPVVIFLVPFCERPSEECS
jgi:hypothetical protein